MPAVVLDGGALVPLRFLLQSRLQSDIINNTLYNPFHRAAFDTDSTRRSTSKVHPRGPARRVDDMNVQNVLEFLNKMEHQYIYNGDKGLSFKGFSSLKNYRPGSLTWIGKEKAIPEGCDFSNISIAVVQKGIDVPVKNQIIASNSKEVFFDILGALFSDGAKILQNTSTVMGKDVHLGKDVVIGCNCVLDGRIKIGNRTIIEHNVVVMNDVTIGDDCIIHSGTVIGKDGFGFSLDKNNIPQKVTHFGGVQIGNRVEIGVNCSVDRGTIDNTVVEDDVKMDSFSLIAHNSMIGKGTVIVGAVIGGSCTVGEKTYIAPRAVIKNQVSIGKNCFIGMNCVVREPLADNMMIPAEGLKALLVKNYRHFL